MESFTILEQANLPCLYQQCIIAAVKLQWSSCAALARLQRLTNGGVEGSLPVGIEGSLPVGIEGNLPLGH